MIATRQAYALRIEARDTTHLAELADRISAAGVLPDEERKTRTEARRHLGA